VIDDQDTGRETPLAKKRRRLSSIHLDEFGSLSTSDREIVLTIIKLIGDRLDERLDDVEQQLREHVVGHTASEKPARNEVLLKAGGIRARTTFFRMLLLLAMVAAAGLAWHWPW
jgi:hypothetical protein